MGLTKVDTGDRGLLAELLDQLLVERRGWSGVTTTDLLAIEQRVWRNGYDLGRGASDVGWLAAAASNRPGRRLELSRQGLDNILNGKA